VSTVSVDLPGNAGNGQALVETHADAITAAQGQTADMYKLTRAGTLIFNGGAVMVGVLVKGVLSFPPTSIGANEAVWGPWTDALSPITWRVTVSRTGPNMYAYKFDGRDKLNESAPFITVLSGNHSPVLDANGHAIDGLGSGNFTLDNDARNMLPMPTTDVGQAHYTYDHTSATVVIDAQFVNVKDDNLPGQRVNLVYSYRATPGQGGTMQFVHSAPPSMAQTTGATWKVKSRWMETGQGRSDVIGEGGDVAAGTQLKLSECWDQSFASTYQRIDGLPAFGWGVEATDCVFTSPEYSNL
jgi:hypothetical protein